MLAVSALRRGTSPATALAVSRRMVFTGLSSRRATYEAWRTCPSGVQSENSTSATNRGSTQHSSPGLRLDQRPGFLPPSRKGELARSIFESLTLSEVASSLLQPVPTLPTGRSPPLSSYTPSSKLPTCPDPLARL